MYELNHIIGNSYYIQSPSKMGLVKLNDTDVCLIDSGNDKDAGRKVRQLLDANGWHLTAIYNTHSNADHIGGNRYLQGQTKCKIYAQGIECDITRHPVLEPAFLYGGFPPKDLRHKFLMAQESDAKELTPGVLPEGFALLQLPGHFFHMVGYLDTLEKVKTMQAAAFVPAHAEVTEDIAPLAQYNIDKVLEIADHMVELCAEPVIFEELLKKLFDDYGLTLTFEQYVLVGSTVKSYLAWLKDTGRLTALFEDNRLLWRRA